jgi:hypothetical protein
MLARYAATVALQAGGEWQRVVLALHDFLPMKGGTDTLRQWKELVLAPCQAVV